MASKRQHKSERKEIIVVGLFYTNEKLSNHNFIPALPFQLWLFYIHWCV